MINLFVNMYRDNNPKRAAELAYCLNTNICNEDIMGLFHVEGRSYNDFFNKIAEISHPDDINIIANSDIFFDNTILFVNQIKADECYALSRRDVITLNPFTSKEVEPMAQDVYTALYPNDSQDVWIFKGVPKGINGDFNMGTLGCDNRIAYEIDKAGYKVINPCTKINCYHLHLSNVRNYNKTEIVPPPYKYVNPC